MSDKNEKIKYLIQLKNLEEKGFFPTKYYTINSKLEDIILEYELLKDKHEIKLKQNLFSDIQKFKEYSNFPIKNITLDADLEIIQNIHKSMKQDYEFCIKQAEFVYKVCLVANEFLKR